MKRFCPLILVIMSAACSRENSKAEDDRFANLQSQPTPKTIATVVANDSIVCDTFDINAKVIGETLELSVGTDLPDDTDVFVSVSRSYLSNGNTARYALDYFSEKSVIGKWKAKHTISIASETWNDELKAKQEQMSRLGMGFTVASINGDIEVSMVVPINQTNPKFGPQNQNLSGRAVASDGLRVVKGIVKLPYPLKGESSENYKVPNLDPRNLEIGQSYVVSRETPLMPSKNPADPLAAIGKMNRLPVGGVFTVIEVSREGSTPWYQVIARRDRNDKIGGGWINSTALVGQELKAEN